MGAGEIIPLLVPTLIIAVVVGIMIGRLIGFGAVCFGVATTLYIAGVLNNAPILSISAIPAFVLGLLCAFESARRIVTCDNFKKRVTDYIAEGQRIFTDNNDQTISTTDYIVMVRSWSKKVSEDIRQHKGVAEMESFLAQASTREYDRGLDDNAIEDRLRRSYATRIVETQKYQLESFRERL